MTTIIGMDMKGLLYWERKIFELLFAIGLQKKKIRIVNSQMKYQINSE